MVVATGAGDRRAQQGAGHRIDLLVDQVCLELVWIDGIQVLGTNRQESCCDQQPSTLRVSVERQQVTGELFGQKPIERKILLEAIDDVVSIAPRMGERNVGFFPTRFGKPSDVEPMTAPSLAELGAIEQSRDDVLQSGLQSAAFDRCTERLQCFSRRRQPHQVEMQPANQRLRRRILGW